MIQAIESLSGEDIFLSVITIGELVKGIELLAPGRRQMSFKSWLEHLKRNFASRILPVDEEVAMIWGQLVAAAQRDGKQVSAVDGLIAATARRHGLSVMTRNVDDFRPTGVPLLNPWPADI